MILGLADFFIALVDTVGISFDPRCIARARSTHRGTSSRHHRAIAWARWRNWRHIHRPRGHGLDIRHFLVDALQNDQYFFQTARQAARIDCNLLIRIRGMRRGYLAGRHAFGKNAVITGSVEPLTAVYFLFGLYVIHAAVPMAQPLQNTADVV